MYGNRSVNGLTIQPADIAHFFVEAHVTVNRRDLRESSTDGLLRP